MIIDELISNPNLKITGWIEYRTELLIYVSEFNIYNLPLQDRMINGKKIVVVIET